MRALAAFARLQHLNHVLQVATRPRKVSRAILLGVLAAVLAAGALPTRATHEGGATHAIQMGTFPLEPGKKIFLPQDEDGWVNFGASSTVPGGPLAIGPWFRSPPQQRWNQCDITDTLRSFTCWDFHFVVPDIENLSDWRLRVAFDADWASNGPDGEFDDFQLGLRSPTGDIIFPRGFGENQYGSPPGIRSAEVFVPQLTQEITEHKELTGDDLPLESPILTPGTWTARIFGVDVSNSRFRLRAVLEELTPAQRPRRQMPPNLVPEPPVHLSFIYDVGGFASCDPSELEIQEDKTDGDEVCLRFSFGHANAGPGPLELIFDTPVTTSGTVSQRIYYSDGTYEDKGNAGTYTYWPTEHQVTGDPINHAHFHYNEMTWIEFFRVDPVNQQVDQLGQPKHASNCSLDRRMSRWHTIYQDQMGLYNSILCDGRMGLSTGWTWLYPYRVAKNAVLFGSVEAQPDGALRFEPYDDGFYLLRITSDPLQLLEEKDETDNLGYAYVTVFHEDSVRKVQLIERGYGPLPTALGGDPANVIDACSGAPPVLYPPNCEGPHQGE